MASRIRFLLLWFILRGSPASSATTSAALASCHQRGPFLAQVSAALKRPSLWPGAFKVAFQKIHSPTTSRAPGWACGCRPPRPPAFRGQPLASAPPGSSFTCAGLLPCWEGQARRGAPRCGPRSHACFRLRHFRRPAFPQPTSAGEPRGTPVICIAIAWFRVCSPRAATSSPEGCFPLLAVGFQGPDWTSGGRVAPGKWPQLARGPRARAAWRPGALHCCWPSRGPPTLLWAAMASRDTCSGPSAFGSRRSRGWERKGPCWRSASRRCVRLHPLRSVVLCALAQRRFSAHVGVGGLEREWGPASCLRMDHRAKGLV